MPVGSYDNFDLLIDRGPNGYRARVVRSLAGESAVEFTLPFTDDELADFLWRSFGRGRHLGARPDGRAEGVNLNIKMLNRRGFGYRNFEHSRLHFFRGLWTIFPTKAGERQRIDNDINLFRLPTVRSQGVHP